MLPDESTTFSLRAWGRDAGDVCAAGSRFGDPGWGLRRNIGRSSVGLCVEGQALADVRSESGHLSKVQLQGGSIILRFAVWKKP